MYSKANLFVGAKEHIMAIGMNHFDQPALLSLFQVMCEDALKGKTVIRKKEL